MPRTTLEVFVANQSKLYQQHLSTITTLEKALEHQSLIATYHTIPKQYKPRLLQAAAPHTAELNRAFNERYEALFFDHLRQVVTTNTIALELNRARLANVIAVTEAKLAESPEPAEYIRCIYDQFTSANRIPNRPANTQLKMKLQSPAQVPQTPSSSTSSRGSLQPQQEANTKRKQTSPHPPTTKQQKIDLFLERKPHQLH